MGFGKIAAGNLALRPLAIFIALFFLAPLAFSAPVGTFPCGSFLTGSGTCSGASPNFPGPSSAITDPGCCAWLGGGWNYGGTPGCGVLGGTSTLPSVTCASLTDNELACKTAGCTWKLPCGSVSFGTGMCSGPVNPNFPSISDPDCCSWLGGTWSVGCAASPVNNMPSFVCADETDNALACISAGCAWKPVCGATVAGSGTCSNPPLTAVIVNCPALVDEGCCNDFSCSWNSGTQKCGGFSGLGFTSCSVFDGNEKKCKAIGCQWCKSSPIFPSCGSVSPNSGTCSGAHPNFPGPSSITDPGCCEWLGGGWNQGSPGCSASCGSGMLPGVTCASLTGNELACRTIGCSWCKNDGQSCAASAECCNMFCNSKSICGCGDVGTGCSSDSNCCSGKCDAASGTCLSPYYFCKKSNFDTTLLLAALGGVGMLAVIAMAYMFGESTSNPRTINWAKIELVQVIFSLFIVLAIMGALSTFCSIQVHELGTMFGFLPQIYAADDTVPIYGAAEIYLGKLQRLAIEDMALLVYNLEAYELRTTFTEYNCASPCTFSMSSTNIAKFSGDSMYLAITNNLLSTATVSYFSATFQFFILKYIESGFLVIFLPLAIVLRSVPFMRQFGGALIALFVGMYLLYPVMIVADAVLAPGLVKTAGGFAMADRTNDNVPCGNALDVFMMRGDARNQISCTTQTNSGNTEEGIKGTRNLNDMDNLNPTPTTGSAFPDAVKLNVLLFLTAVFLPAFGFVVIAAFVRGIAHFLGEDVDISKLGQMI